MAPFVWSRYSSFTDDFGYLGQRPTHPRLLDHLATQFMNDGWSIKKLIKHIVLSRTFQMSSQASDSVAEEGPYEPTPASYANASS